MIIHFCFGAFNGTCKIYKKANYCDLPTPSPPRHYTLPPSLAKTLNSAPHISGGTNISSTWPNAQSSTQLMTRNEHFTHWLSAEVSGSVGSLLRPKVADEWVKKRENGRCHRNWILFQNNLVFQLVILLHRCRSHLPHKNTRVRPCC